MNEPVQPWGSLNFLPEGTVVAETHHGKHKLLNLECQAISLY